MPLPDLHVIADGATPAGERWYLRAGGPAGDYHTMLETVHPDGRRDEGGMGGPLLYPGRLLNDYIGRADDGPLRVIFRTDRRVRRLVLYSGSGERCELRPAAYDATLGPGVMFFAGLLPWTAVDQVQLLDAAGRELLS
jgi:hypothetical protein